MRSEEHLALLGLEAEDLVTGFSGVVTSISFDLYGCVQAIVTSKITKENKNIEHEWFDITRLKIISKKRVMNAPDFGKGYIAEGRKGGFSKPLPR
jgi:hypothetical protein